MPSWLPIHWNGSNITCIAMCKGKSSTQTKASLVFVKYGKYGATPTMHVQGQIKFKWACLIKHLADADIPNARLSAKPKLNSNLCFLESIWNKHWKSDSKVQAQIRSCWTCGLEHKETTKNNGQCQISAYPPPPPSCLLLVGAIPNLNLVHFHTRDFSECVVVAGH